MNEHRMRNIRSIVKSERLSCEQEIERQARAAEKEKEREKVTGLVQSLPNYHHSKDDGLSTPLEKRSSISRRTSLRRSTRRLPRRVLSIQLRGRPMSNGRPTTPMPSTRRRKGRFITKSKHL